MRLFSTTVWFNRFVVSAFFIFQSFCSFIVGQNDSSQQNDTLNVIDEAGFKQGYWKKYKTIDGKDILTEEGKYKNNKKEGKWTEYYYNGKIKNTLEFVDGRPAGEARMYNESGLLTEKGKWKRNKWVGEYYNFYGANGSVKHLFNFNDEGKREGTQKYYYPNGKLFIEGNYKDGKEEGNFTIYNFKGNKVGTQEFKEGKETPESIAGRKFDIESLKRQSDSLEKTVQVTKIGNLVLSGFQTLYTKDKQISKEGIFYNNRLYEGKAYIYDEKGKLTKKAIYKGGEYIEDEFDSKMSSEEKIQKEILAKLKLKDEELFGTINALIIAKEQEMANKESQLKEQTLQNQVLAKEKQIKDLLLNQQAATLRAKEAENMKRELEITTLNKDKRIKEIELKNQKAENDKKEQALKLSIQQKKFQEAEIKQQKFTKNLTILGLAVVGFFCVFILLSLQKNKKANKTISLQKKEVENQKYLLEQKNREITDSINYAERIQRSLLASKKVLDENLREYFVLFKPKDIVSGDFYWASKLSNGNFALATADSTGHGVPGAIMSIVNIASLKEAVIQGITSPDLILNETRRLVIENLKNDGSAGGGKDGMDGSLICFDFKNSTLLCACANNPLWIVRGMELIEIKSDRMPIGKHDKDAIPFNLHSFNLQKGDVIYSLTDGYPDQFGGPNGKKFKYKQLQKLLLKLANEPMEVQNLKLEEAFNKWKGSLEQVDDVCLIGVRI